MGIMCHAILCCPLFHASSDSIGNLSVELYAIVHHINHFLVCIPTEGDKWTIYWVHFRGEHSSVYAEGADKPQEVRVALNSNINNRNNIFEEILSTLHFSNGIEDLRYASSLLHYYLASLRYLRQYRNTARYDDTDSNRPFNNDKNAGLVNAAIHFMKENVERRITLQDILDYVGYSSTRFSALFKQQTPAISSM